MHKIFINLNSIPILDLSLKKKSKHNSINSFKKKQIPPSNKTKKNTYKKNLIKKYYK